VLVVLLSSIALAGVTQRREAPAEISMSEPYPRDMIGYGREPPLAQWPGDARLALQFVINYEEGAENAILHGDPAAEAFLSEFPAQPVLGMRNMKRSPAGDRIC